MLDRVRLDRLAPLRQLTQRRNVHIAKRRNRQRARNRRRRHRQHVRIHPFAPQDAALVYPKAMLLIRHDKPQLPEIDILLNQRMRPDHHIDHAHLQGGQHIPPLPIC